MEVGRERGFTLVQIMVVGVLIAVFTSFSLPNLLKGRMGANEVSAAAILRNLASAELLAQLSATIDVNNNGIGEFAFFAELAGAANIRSDESGGTAYLDVPGQRAKVAVGGGRRTEPGAAVPAGFRPSSPGTRLDPAPLSANFGNVVNGRIEHNGYIFQLFLPKEGMAPAAESENGGGAGVSVSAIGAESYWCCYAWPVKYAGTGRRCFFANQSGKVYAAQNLSGQYDGHEVAPEPLAAFAEGKKSTLASLVAATSVGNDGQVWAEQTGVKAAADGGESTIGFAAFFSAGTFALATLVAACCLALIIRRKLFS